ncbi:hypothetical protein EYS09_28020 [Streptomyces kasugaensis]|uniref:Uncharacterized protein n=1 Tax=Streptomyces kasugaensis TaxID=1946 RepID=A0A4Q9HNK6_STRKA|nr:hypothetical protein EYS09_28020 [Streptomyces kasugaensis]
MSPPPECPDPACGRRLLWKDTTHTKHGPEFWKWTCSGCRRQYEPTHHDRRRYAHAAPGPAAAAPVVHSSPGPPQPPR